jgi:lambda repressor-like predicted transcriptional regulator
MSPDIVIANIKIGNGLTVSQLAAGNSVCKQALYQVLPGNSKSNELHKIIADATGKPVAELFPEASPQEAAA